MKNKPKISFSSNGSNKIVEKGIHLPNIIAIQDQNGLLHKLNLKVYLNGKRLRKKIIAEGDSCRFVRPLKLTKKDELTYTWEVKI